MYVTTTYTGLLHNRKVLSS